MQYQYINLTHVLLAHDCLALLGVGVFVEGLAKDLTNPHNTEKEHRDEAIMHTVKNRKRPRETDAQVFENDTCTKNNHATPRLQSSISSSAKPPYPLSPPFSHTFNSATTTHTHPPPRVLLCCCLLTPLKFPQCSSCMRTIKSHTHIDV